ncbi:MAG: polysaccharide deacetylase family protein [Clostridiaceae bacterium]
MNKISLSIIFSIFIMLILSFMCYKYYFQDSAENTVLLSTSNAEKVKTSKTNEKKLNQHVDTEDFEDVTKVSIPVLMYHSINDNDPSNTLVVPTNQFRAQMQFLKDQGFTTIDLNELNTYLKTGKKVPKKSVAITFDDGYLDNYTNAYPILKELDFKATIFTITDAVDKHPNFITSAMIKEMSKNNISIQSHTVHHVELDKLSYDEQLKELKDSKDYLDKLLNQHTNAICYPVGRFNDDTIRAAKKAGYKLGFTTKPGYGKLSEGPFSIHRVRIFPGSLDQFTCNFN